MNPRLEQLKPYPFERLSRLLGEVTPPADIRPINISIGEPKHAVAPFLRQAMIDAMDGIANYPTTRGEPALREAIAGWLVRRYALTPTSMDPDRNLLPVNGTREALFSIAQAVVDSDRHKDAVVLSPNPFYQIYEGAALMAGAEPVYIDATEESNFLPRFTELPAELLDRTQLLYLCSPSNPTGAVHSLEELTRLIELAEKHDFIIASDECYSEIWYERPPPGLLQAADASGRHDYARCLVFHSLSKRSNMPGARSGFVAGDAKLLAHYFRLRTYTGCAMPPFIQRASAVAWSDESHVADNRALYRAKLEEAVEILSPTLPVTRPQASFYLWLRVPGGGEQFTQRLLAEQNVTVLPGAYLGRSPNDENPGAPYIRVALVAPLEDNREAMQRIAACASQGTS
ncbi:MAG: succinyldiaminopimelate transaminase [Magnetococcales bacterium]|nr:succinyldiaminopimelate transaminase [Magnetococcales bacterium]